MFIFIYYHVYYYPKFSKHYKKACLKWSPVWVCPQRTQGLRCTDGRPLRHPHRDVLVPYLTVNGFGLLINSDEWRPIHNPLYTWPQSCQCYSTSKGPLQQTEANYCPLLAELAHWQLWQMCISGCGFLQRQNLVRGRDVSRPQTARPGRSGFRK